MKLHPPFAISARLLPALKIGDAWLSWDGSLFFLDTPEFEFVIDDFRPGPVADTQECFRAILSFMDAAAESRAYRDHCGGEIDPDGNETLFPPHIVDWIMDNLCEIQMLECEIEEGELIT